MLMGRSDRVFESKVLAPPPLVTRATRSPISLRGAMVVSALHTYPAGTTTAKSRPAMRPSPIRSHRSPRTRCVVATPGTPPSLVADLQPNEDLRRLQNLFCSAIRDVDAHARMRRRPEIPTLEEARADLRDGLYRGRARTVGHPHGRLASSRVAESDLRATVAEKTQARQRRLGRDELIGTLRHLLKRRHLTLGHGGPDLHPGLQVLRALAFLLLADDLLDLRAQPAEGLLQRGHLGHDFPHAAGELVV